MPRLFLPTDRKNYSNVKNQNNEKHKRLIFITGLSGAGKSVALDSLEDIGFYCIDNLPVGLIDGLGKQINDTEMKHYTNVALGIDARSPLEDIEKLPQIIKKLNRKIKGTELIFFEASDEILAKRFSETRRKHPLSSDKIVLGDAIHKEKEILANIAEIADLKIDTSSYTVHELRDLIKNRVGTRSVQQLSLQFCSFGYKHGIPNDADYVFDIRCLPNPYWHKNLRSYSGKQEPVITFLSNQPLVNNMFNQICSFLEAWIPQYEKDSRSYLTIAIGCTGGTHRSVYITEKLSKYFIRKHKNVITKHRDLK